MIPNFTNMVKTINVQIQEAPVNSKQDNYKKYTPEHDKITRKKSIKIVLKEKYTMEQGSIL